MEFNEYLYRTYSSWLGKNIGVIMGASIESWLHKDIMRTYGEIDGYPLYYKGHFAADDDINGPLFFYRSLLNEPDENIDVEKMAEVILGYIADGHGFFWWGGKGISTEDTAYQNLKSGMSGLMSGKIETNGKTIAEQIGGQIFSDCWGYVAYGNPDTAKKLAMKMSSITHDGDGLRGGIFVAVMIALAYTMNDAYEIVNEALNYIDDSDYKKAVMDIIRIYDEGLSYKEAEEYVLDHYRYANYDGVCHIIPNTAIMILALLYGENDFDKTLKIVMECGYDTDCNGGNVGSIMGAMLGVKGINEKWIRPLGDEIISSSSVPYLNLDTISNTALKFALMGAKLKGERHDEYLNNHYYFDLPYATHGFNTDYNRYNMIVLNNYDKALHCIITGYKSYKCHIYKKTYYMPDEVFDARYEPSMTPLINNGSKIRMKLSGPKDRISLRYYVKDRYDNYYYGDCFNIDGEASWYEFTVDFDKKACYVEFGLEVILNERIFNDVMLIHEFEIVPVYNYEIDFRNEVTEDWGLNYLGDSHIFELSQLANQKRLAKYTKDGLELNGDTVCFGNIYATLHQLELSGKFDNIDGFELRIDLKDHLHYLGISFSNSNVKAYIRNGRNEIKELFFGNLMHKNANFSLILKQDNGIIILSVGDEVFKINHELSDISGAIAFASSFNTCGTIIGCKLESSNCNI